MGELSNLLNQIQSYFSHHTTALVAAFLGYGAATWYQSWLIGRTSESLGKSEMDQDLEHYAYQTRLDISFVVILLSRTNGLLAAILAVLLYQLWR
jgi:hypothetical protein